MAVTLAALVTRLQSSVPARDGVPAAGDYAQHVKDGVLQLSQDVPLIRRATLAVVSGTASYTLPTDLLYLIEMPSLSTPDGVLVTDGGLIPVGTGWAEEYYIEGSSLIFSPVTPGYTVSRGYRYAAGYVLTGGSGSETYAALNENGARVALLYAQYLALTQQASVVAGDGWKYQIGDEMVDKSNQGRGMLGQALGALANYQNAVRQLKGYGSRGDGGAGVWAY